MYRESMFKEGSFKGAVFLASGFCGSVYDLGNGWVVKYAKQDGTLNYLEWCKAMQDAGRGMPGMPEIESIVHLSHSRYMVTMKKYTPANRAVGNREAINWYCYGPLYGTPAIKHIDELLVAYTDYVRATFVETNEGIITNRAKGDLHFGNFMFDGDLLILTDPSASDYWDGSHLKAIDLLH